MDQDEVIGSADRDPSNQGNDTSTEGENRNQPAETQNPTETQNVAQHIDDQESEARSRKRRATVFQFIGLGSELATFTLVGTGIGYAIDAASDNAKPLATAGATLIGFTLGMIRFIGQVRKSP